MHGTMVRSRIGQFIVRVGLITLLSVRRVFRSQNGKNALAAALGSASQVCHFVLRGGEGKRKERERREGAEERWETCREKGRD